MSLTSMSEYDKLLNAFISSTWATNALYSHQLRRAAEKINANFAFYGIGPFYPVILPELGDVVEASTE